MTILCILPLVVGILFMPIISYSECIEYRIIDYGDRIEAVCTGSPQDAASNITSKEYRQSSQTEPQVVRDISQITTVNSCKLIQANHYDAGRNPNIEVEVGCEIVGGVFRGQFT